MSQVEYLEEGVRIKENKEEGQIQQDCKSMQNSLKFIWQPLYMQTKGKE